MSWQIRISAAARRDMEKALEWTLAEFGPRQHAEYFELIRITLKTIGDDPKDKQSLEKGNNH